MPDAARRGAPGRAACGARCREWSAAARVAGAVPLAEAESSLRAGARRPLTGTRAPPRQSGPAGVSGGAQLRRAPRVRPARRCPPVLLGARSLPPARALPGPPPRRPSYRVEKDLYFGRTQPARAAPQRLGGAPGPRAPKPACLPPPPSPSPRRLRAPTPSRAQRSSAPVASRCERCASCVRRRRPPGAPCRARRGSLASAERRGRRGARRSGGRRGTGGSGREQGRGRVVPTPAAEAEGPTRLIHGAGLDAGARPCPRRATAPGRRRTPDPAVRATRPPPAPHAPRPLGPGPPARPAPGSGDRKHPESKRGSATL